MLHTFAPTVMSESILFHDKLTTAYAPADALFRRVAPEDAGQIAQQQLDSQARWLVAVGDIVAAAGDILFHYNRPYGDIYMKLAEPFRRRGVGTYLVQELKRVYYEGEASRQRDAIRRMSPAAKHSSGPASFPADTL